MIIKLYWDDPHLWLDLTTDPGVCLPISLYSVLFLPSFLLVCIFPRIESNRQRSGNCLSLHTYLQRLPPFNQLDAKKTISSR